MEEDLYLSDDSLRPGSPRLPVAGKIVVPGAPVSLLHNIYVYMQCHPNLTRILSDFSQYSIHKYILKYIYYIYSIYILEINLFEYPNRSSLI